jgi:hypothetical protein
LSWGFPGPPRGLFCRDVIVDNLVEDRERHCAAVQPQVTELADGEFAPGAAFAFAQLEDF